MRQFTCKCTVYSTVNLHDFISKRCILMNLLVPLFLCSYNEFGLERLRLKKMENHHNNISDDLEFSEQIIWIMIMILSLVL